MSWGGAEGPDPVVDAGNGGAPGRRPCVGRQICAHIGVLVNGEVRGGWTEVGGIPWALFRCTRGVAE